MTSCSRLESLSALLRSLSGGSHTRELLRLFCRNCPQVPEIALVSDQHDHDVSIGMIPQLLKPSSDIVVCLMLADIVDQQRSNSPSVVCGCDCTISLLSSCVPDLRLDCFCVNLDGSRCKFDADCGFGVEVEFVPCESREQVTLADSAVWKTTSEGVTWMTGNGLVFVNASGHSPPIRTTLKRKSYSSPAPAIETGLR
jgi:hypothetical protein